MAVVVSGKSSGFSFAAGHRRPGNLDWQAQGAVLKKRGSRTGSWSTPQVSPQVLASASERMLFPSHMIYMARATHAYLNCHQGENFCILKIFRMYKTKFIVYILFL
jgi:hypothetical protein